MISVIVCTYNRDRVLEDTVRSFLECRTGGIEHEVLILDNNSTDRTREIGERFAARHSRVRYLNEPCQGHPHAKNRGIRESCGEIVAFADDDVYFTPGWLEAVRSSFDRRPEFSCIGGRVVPSFEADRPAWLDDDLLWIYGVTRYGDQEREIRHPEIPIGCNMAFRREVFERNGGFVTSLGRKPGILLSGDEDEFLIRAAKAGMKTLYVPEAQVSHRIPPARLARRWVISRFYWAGVSDIAMRQLGDDRWSRAFLARKSARALLRLLREWKEAGSLLRADSDGKIRSVRKQVDFCYQAGLLRQMIAEAIALPAP